MSKHNHLKSLKTISCTTARTFRTENSIAEVMRVTILVTADDGLTNFYDAKGSQTGPVGAGEDKDKSTEINSEILGYCQSFPVIVCSRSLYIPALSSARSSDWGISSSEKGIFIFEERSSSSSISSIELL